MPSEKPSNTTRPRKRRKYQYFLDRNLGRVIFPGELRNAGLIVTAQDDTTEFSQAERDPWMYYQCGKRRHVVVTTDQKFRRSFPHMAAIALGDTVVLAFTNNTYNAERRARAFLAVLSEIEDELRKRNRRKRWGFIGVIGISGTFRVDDDKPLPHRKLCDPRDWESYRRVCESEGVLALVPEQKKPASAGG